MMNDIISSVAEEEYEEACAEVYEVLLNLFLSSTIIVETFEFVHLEGGKVL